MDNVPIYTYSVLGKLVKKIYFGCLHILPYSPFLSSTEEVWSKVKGGIKRHTLRVDDELTKRTIC